MASGSSGRNNSGSKGYDFSTDDVLCSYEDYANQDAAANGTHSDPNTAPHSAQEFHKNRMSRSSMFAAPAYAPPEDSVNPDVVSAVEKTVKKHTDNLMRFLEGMSSRLSELELYCYNLDKSIGEMRSDLTRNHGEADAKLKSVEKHLQEVHRSVQIVRDKQELAETQKELAKLQLAQKEEARVAPAAPVSDPRKPDNSQEMPGQQLALALPHQIARHPSFISSRPAEQHHSVANPPSQGVTQPQAYYLSQSQIPNLPAHTPAPPQLQPPQNQYLPSDSPYRTPQMQDLSRVPPQPTQSQVHPQAQPQPHYQQQWPQQATPVLPQSRPQPTGYPSQTESHPSSMPMQVSYSGIPQLGSSRADVVPYGYGGPGRTFQQQAPIQQSPTPQPLRGGGFGVQQNDGYPTSGSVTTLSPANAYMMYEGEPGRTHSQQPHFAPGGYPPTSAPPQVPQPNAATASPLARRNTPYGELVDKLVSMGYRTEHVANVIQRQEDSGLPVDFNAVLDRLNGHTTAGPQRGWSG